MLNNGFDTRTIDLDREDIDESIKILVISDLRTPLSDVAMTRVQNYIDKGGNLFILGDYGREDNMNQLMASLGVKCMSGVLVNENEYTSPTVLVAYFTPEAAKRYPMYEKLQRYGYVVALPTAQALDYSGVKDFEITPVLVSDKDAWIEKETTDFVDGEFVFNPEAGEMKGEYSPLITLSRKVGDKDQRIVISGDADVIANEALTSQFTVLMPRITVLLMVRSAGYLMINFPLIPGGPSYIDSRIRLPKGCRSWVNTFCMGIFPLSIAFLGIMTILRRKRK